MGVMDPTLPSNQPPDKAWTRADVRRHAQNLFEMAPESAVKLKCLELILDLIPPEEKKASGLASVASKARTKANE